MPSRMAAIGREMTARPSAMRPNDLANRSQRAAAMALARLATAANWSAVVPSGMDTLTLVRMRTSARSGPGRGIPLPGLGAAGAASIPQRVANRLRCAHRSSRLPQEVDQ